jgi:hypothetical protein
MKEGLASLTSGKEFVPANDFVCDNFYRKKLDDTCFSLETVAGKQDDQVVVGLTICAVPFGILRETWILFF